MREDQRQGRRRSAAVTAAVMMLLLLTWWARGAADAAQTSAAVVFGPVPGIVTWSPSWLARDTVRESSLIACVGSGLIALGAFVRRTTRDRRED